MEWMESLTRAVGFMEANLTRDIGVEDVAGHVYAASANFQRVFRLVTGVTIGEYIRNRRLTLAGQALLRGERIGEVAARYQYDAQESFSKAFSRFHGVPPSGVPGQGAALRVFHPLTIHMQIQGGFDMSRTLINHIPIHPLQYPQQGQNDVFNGCMKFLMECIGEENEAYDYWFFTAVSGDSYVQVVNTNKAKWSVCLSHARFDEALIRRVFGAIGYGYAYLAAADWQRDKEALRTRLMASIDRGIPVIGKGFYSIFHGRELPTSEVSCIIGYERGGECFYRLTEESTELVPFTLEDGLPYIFVFAGDKRAAPPVAEVYREALLRAPALMRTPPYDGGDVRFGNDAFMAWADMLEGGFYRMPRAEFEATNAIARWRYYGVYLCITATNIFAKRYTTDRAIRMNPGLAQMAPQLDAAYAELDRLHKALHAAGGGFDVAYEVLQDDAQCRVLAGILRQFPAVMDGICGIIEGMG